MLKWQVKFTDDYGDPEICFFDTEEEAWSFLRTNDHLRGYTVTPVIQCYLVGIGLSDLAYGGPEEGGWYYDTQDIESDHAVFLTEEEAREHLKVLDEKIKEQQLNKGRPKMSSVLSRGEYRSILIEQFLPLATHTPLIRPRYS